MSWIKVYDAFRTVPVDERKLLNGELCKDGKFCALGLLAHKAGVLGNIVKNDSSLLDPLIVKYELGYKELSGLLEFNDSLVAMSEDDRFDEVMQFIIERL